MLLKTETDVGLGHAGLHIEEAVHLAAQGGPEPAHQEHEEAAQD
mgnify:CR=1 FL=1